jgi:hypothetical protein
MGEVIFSSDIDWCHEEVMANTVEVFESHGVKCTFFATHKSDVLLRSNKDLFEVGLHPNFNNLLLERKGDRTAKEIVADLLEIYPAAVGLRSHSLTQSSPLLDIAVQAGLKYESNMLVPYQRVKPFRSWNGLIRLPFSWEDDVHWTYGHSFDSFGMEPSNDVTIVSFHPIHVFLNAENHERYAEAKKNYHSPAHLKGLINTKTKGARTMLIELLEGQRKLGASRTLAEYAATV